MDEKKKKDLLKNLNEKRTQLREFRFGVSGSKIKNVKEATTVRKEIARILTELNKKEVTTENHG
ncbi:50S ribosomal protein L29 [bacterium]|nr:50S ribosomal protein L29 [bacterium]|tara:strand:+ start:10117 stop:10308 length:192 start_codon:yes stop_codon:yes gene_type:complete